MGDPDYTFGGKVHNVPMKTEHGMQLVQHWVDTMLGTFLSSFADRRFLKSKSRHVINEFGDCNKKATNIPLQARCLSRLMRDQITGKKYAKKFDSKLIKLTSKRLEKYRHKKKTIHKSSENESHGWIGGFRVKRKSGFNDVVTKKDYELMTPGVGKMTPFGKVAHVLLNAVLAAKNKTYAQPWQETIAKISDSAKHRKEERKRLEEESLENMDQFVFRGMRDRGMIQEDLDTVIRDPVKLKRWLAKKRSSKTQEPMQRLVALLRQGLKIGYSFTGKNASDLDDKTLKVASPRFLSVVPEEEEYKNETMEFLSPSLFSLHDKGKGIENLTSLPNLMKSFSRQDQQKWMDLIMEAAGVVDTAEKLETDYSEKSVKDLKKQYEVESRAKDGTPLYFTRDNVTRMFGSYEERKVDTYTDFTRSLSKDQVKELNRTGYIMMTPKQLHMLYGPQSPYNNSEALARLSALDNSSHLEEHIINDVHRIAQLQSFNIRQKDLVLSPVSFTWIVLQPGLMSQPLVLSPVIFSPIILSPSVLGPVILSPALFVPVVLSPRVLGPLILAPLAFVPFILSPVVLHPLILTPGIFSPLVLSPLVLSPLILSPQAFSPFVLSPLVLSPIILNPTVGSPLVLNPFVLSPIIWSPQAFGALILSPYALSPVIQSPLFHFSVILSPSWLSK
ncbi:moulting cycle domain-containing protein [Ditylenchus destructor]|nr:moulting cycle domain-containing protein [Ditylenchus destructor]